MDEMGITELDLERQFLFGIYRKHIHLSKQNAKPITFQPSFSETKNSKCEESGDAPQAAGNDANILRSPMVGVAYLSPEPGAKTFTSVGAKIKAGDTVVLIEAMKTFNPIKSDRNGTVKEILVSDGAAVEYDQPLIIIE
jgi:acetyl-CoA carboxylase biotin carboxyl carrier protein